MATIESKDEQTFLKTINLKQYLSDKLIDYLNN
jgi:hypothetical protein